MMIKLPSACLVTLASAGLALLIASATAEVPPGGSYCYFVYKEVPNGTEVPKIPTLDYKDEMALSLCPDGPYNNQTWPEKCRQKCFEYVGTCMAVGYVVPNDKAVLQMSCSDHDRPVEDKPNGNYMQQCYRVDYWASLQTPPITIGMCDDCFTSNYCVPPDFVNWTEGIITSPPPYTPSNIVRVNSETQGEVAASGAVGKTTVGGWITGMAAGGVAAGIWFA